MKDLFRSRIALSLLFGMGITLNTSAAPFHFSTGDPDGKIGTASRPGSAGKIEIESADDFVLSGSTSINKISFTGLIPKSVSVEQIVVEMYRVFPLDSDVVRTPNVLTRVNSPSDVAFVSKDSAASELSFSTTGLGDFTVANSIINGINPQPNQLTGGEGAVSGEEVRFDILLNTPFVLPKDHYFFIPQVRLSGGEFLWLSAPKPIVSPGTPFLPDLQSWIRNENLAPDWSRVGTDIVGPPTNGGAAPTFNAAFSLDGELLPEPSMALLMSGMLLAASAIPMRSRARSKS